MGPGGRCLLMLYELSRKARLLWTRHCKSWRQAFSVVTWSRKSWSPQKGPLWPRLCQRKVVNSKGWNCLNIQKAHFCNFHSEKWKKCKRRKLLGETSFWRKLFISLILRNRWLHCDMPRENFSEFFYKVIVLRRKWLILSFLGFSFNMK